MRRFTAISAATVVATAALAVTGGAAFASPPSVPWTPATQNGTVTLYNSAGTVITEGQISNKPLAAFYIASATQRSGDTQSVLQFQQPNPSANVDGWNADSAGGSAYPDTTSTDPAVVTGASTPVAVGHSTDLSLLQFINEFPNGDTTGFGCAYASAPSGCTNTAWANLYDLRMYTFNGASNSNTYADVAFQVSNLTYNSGHTAFTGGVWREISPTASKWTTGTTLSAAPSPGGQGNNVTLTATTTGFDGTHPAGSVQFFDGSASLGSANTNSSGVATLTTTFSSTGTRSLSAVYSPATTGSPAPNTDYTGSTGTANEQIVPGTTTTLTLSNGYTNVGQSATLTANVKDSNNTGINAGKVTFYDTASGSPVAINTTPVDGSGNTTPGQYVFTLTSGFTAGTHVVYAAFTPNDPNSFSASQSPSQTFITQSGACSTSGSTCTDPQTFDATINAGTLVISSPYNDQNHLHLGTLSYDPTNKIFTGHTTFDNIQVTDQTSGDKGWTLKGYCAQLTDGGSHPNSVINGENVGLTGLSYTRSSGVTATATLTDVPAGVGIAPGDTGSQGLGGPSATSAHTLAAVAADPTASVVEDGVYTIQGTLTLNAPASTEAGLFTGTITFTLSQ